MFYFLFTLIAFSSMEVISKPLMSFMDPFHLTFYRFFTGFSVLLSFALIKGRVKEIFSVDKRNLLTLAALGFLNVFFSMSMLQSAVKHSTAASAAVIFCSNPLFVFLLSVITGNEWFSIRKLSGFIMGILGIYIIINPNGFKIEAGDIFALLASFSFALYTFTSKKAAMKTKPLIVNIISFFFGLLIFVAYMQITGISMAFPEEITSSGSNLVRFAYLGIIVSAVAYITFIGTIKKYSPVAASVIFLLKPGVATFFSYLFLSEQLEGSFFIGLFLSLLGSMFIIANGKKKIVVTDEE